MNIKEFQLLLSENPGCKMHWMFSDASFVPEHYHITEVGRLKKDFIDCGGTLRSVCSCILQVWVADDTDHRLDATKLLSIVDLARSAISIDDETPVEIEFEANSISQFPIGGVESTPSGLLFYLGAKHTACLAPEKCKVGNKGCC